MITQKGFVSKFTTLLLLTLITVYGNAQQPDIIQLSGIVTSQQTMFPIAYATVSVPSAFREVNATADGFFSIVVKRSDTLQFSAIGYKPKFYVVPDTGDDKIESIAVLLAIDTLTLDPFVIYPWPSPEDFREAFLAYQEVQQYQMGPILGIKSPTEIDTVPKAPSPIMNPISFFYEEVVKPIQWSKKKKNMVDKLPEWGD